MTDKPTLLGRCLVAGDVLALFPLLKSWPAKDLKRLLAECDEASKLADEKWAELACDPRYFFSAKRSGTLDSARFQFDCMLSEICSVAEYYLEPERRALLDSRGEKREG